MRPKRLSLKEQLWFQLKVCEYLPLPDPVRTLLIKASLPTFLDDDYYGRFGDQNVIFLHVPKTGGTSLSKALGLKYGHVPVSRFINTDQKRFERAYSFAFVRNPWDRLFSSFNYLHAAIGINQSRDVRWAETNLSIYKDFEHFVLSLKSAATQRRIWQWPHFRPQADWLCVAGEKNTRLSTIGRFESLKSDFNAIAKHLDVQLELPHDRKAKEYMQKNYTDEMISIVGDLYQKDCMLFNYSAPT